MCRIPTPCVWPSSIAANSAANRHADLMFELVSRRYQSKSTLVTTNRPFAEWREVFPNTAIGVWLFIAWSCAAA